MKPKYTVTITEYGSVLIEYSNSNRERFLEETRRIVDECIRKSGSGYDGLKNINIHIAQFE